MSLIDDDRQKTPKLRLGGNEPVSTPPPSAPPAPPTIPAMSFTPPSPSEPTPQPKPPPPSQGQPAAKPAIPPAVPPSPVAISPEETEKARSAGIATAVGILALLVLLAVGSIYWLFIAADSPEETVAKAESIPAAPDPAPSSAENTPESTSEVSLKTTTNSEGALEETGLVRTMSRGRVPVPSHGTRQAAETLSSVRETASPDIEPSDPAPTGQVTTSSETISQTTVPAIRGQLFPDPDPELIALVEIIPISGIRPAGNESRAMINGELYLVGDQIAGTDLRLVATNAYQLLFQDSRGAIYRRNF